MRDNEDLARPSLLLAGHDKAQREHKHLGRHKHHHFHRRQAASAVTEVVQTVSVVKQVDVDSQGRTLSVETIVQSARNPSSTPTPSSTSVSTTANSVASSASPMPASPVAAPVTEDLARPPPPPPAAAPSPEPSPEPSSSATSSPEPSSQEATSSPSPPSTPSPTPVSTPPSPPTTPSPTSTPAEPTETSSDVPLETTPPAPDTSSLPDTTSLTDTTSPTDTTSHLSTETGSELPPNSTPYSTNVPIPAPAQVSITEPASTPLPTAPAALPFSSFSVPANITTLISSSSGFTQQSFSNSSHLSNSLAHLTLLDETSSRTRSTSSRYSPTSSFQSTRTTGTGDPGYYPGGVPLPAGATAVPESGSGADKSSAPSTPVVVASVVGSVAGASIVFLVLLLLVKWWKRNQSRIALGDGDAIDGTESGLGGAASRGMVQRRSLAQVVPAALASLTGFKRSQKQDQFEPPPAEQGFYRVSGRKIQSVLQTGGDGFGDEDVGGGTNAMSGSPLYNVSRGLHGGTGPSSSSPHVGISIQRDPENPIMRPSPARTPVTEPGPFASMDTGPLTLPPRRPDALGRSRPSQDSSHPSRFTELV